MDHNQSIIPRYNVINSSPNYKHTHSQGASERGHLKNLDQCLFNNTAQTTIIKYWFLRILVGTLYLQIYHTCFNYIGTVNN